MNIIINPKLNNEIILLLKSLKDKLVINIQLVLVKYLIYYLVYLKR